MSARMIRESKCGKGDWFPSDSSDFAIAAFSDAKDLRVPKGTHVTLDGSVARIGNRCTAPDHVDLPIAWLFGSQFLKR